MKFRSCPVHAVFAILHRPENPPALEADMKRTALAFGAALTLLGGCAAPYGTSGSYYGGGGYYEPDYYGPTVYAQPYGGYGGGYSRDHRDGDRTYRDQDRNQDRNRDHDRGDRQDNRQGNRQDNNRGNRQGNNQPAPQTNFQANAQNNVQPGSGYHGGDRLPNGDRITRGNFWQLNQAQQSAAPQPSGAQPSGDSGGGRMGRHRAD
jgi:hypothetical protein